MKPFKEEFNHHNHRRRHGHDYRAPWKYHITIGKNASAPPFSRLVWEQLAPGGLKVDYTPTGYCISDAIRQIPSIEPHLQVYQYIIMPDHLHLLLRVKETMQRHLGLVIHDFKKMVTQRLGQNVFTESYNDRIVYPERDLNTLFKYIRDNPYRLAVRQARPDFFQKSRAIAIDGRPVACYGNLFLLKNPFKQPLVVHRADTPARFEKKFHESLYTAINGGVVVSPFISPREKEIRKAIESVGGRMILIADRPLIERQKPSQHNFDLCTRGQLLIVSPLDYLDRPPSAHPTRDQCLDMNSLALSLCSQNRFEAV